MIDWFAAARAQQTRFWSKIDRNGPVHSVELGNCWVWTGNLSPDGYGQFMITSPLLPEKPRQKAARSHRVAWELTHGVAASESLVLHKCDNPKCCNPAHLFLGNQLDNINDMMRKGRYVNGIARAPSAAARGEANGAAKLTGSQVLEIIAARRSGSRVLELAKLFNVSVATVKRICAGRQWRHIGGTNV